MNNRAAISALQLSSLVIFRNLALEAPLQRLEAFLRSPSVEGYCSFVSSVYDVGCDFTSYLLDAASSDDNIYMRMLARGEKIPGVIEDCVSSELKLLSGLAELESNTLRAMVEYEYFLPEYITSRIDFRAEFAKRTKDIGKTGYGKFAGSIMFSVHKGELIPVRSADNISLDSLVSYSLQRRQVIDNTRALVNGLPAANVLLYGDAGTGKSSTVKAVVNHLAGDGLRLVELRKDQLNELPAVMAQLKDNPLKFILFIDDLSFRSDDDSFGSLKAILEGSSSMRSSNVAIYATSNRRHLVKESFADRDGSDDVHRRDTIQEVTSLSERFGLTVMFSTPNKPTYLEIVRALAEMKGITMPVSELESRAEVFALEKGGRSARAAEQFTNSIFVEQNLKD